MQLKLNIDWVDFITGGGALSLMGAIIMITGSMYVLLQSTDQSFWHQTTGTVLLSRIKTNPPGSAHSSQELFTYEYEVNGQSFRSDRYSFASGGGDRTVAIKKYKRGDTVNVFYKPTDPSIAVLKIESPGLFVYLVLLAGFLCLLGAAGCLLAQNFMALFSLSGVQSIYHNLTGAKK